MLVETVLLITFYWNVDNPPEPTKKLIVYAHSLEQCKEEAFKIPKEKHLVYKICIKNNKIVWAVDGLNNKIGTGD